MGNRFRFGYVLSGFVAFFVLPFVLTRKPNVRRLLYNFINTRRKRKMNSAEVPDIFEDQSKSSDADDEVTFAGKGLKLDSETSAKEVVDAINNCPNMVTLCMEGNTLGVQAAKAIAKALEGQPNFKRALWKDMFTGRLKYEIPEALSFLSSGIRLANAQLTELDLSDNAFGPIGAEGIVCLLKSPSCFSLKELRLNNNGLGITGGKLLASALSDCLKNSEHLPNRFALEVLVCGRNRLEVDGAKALAAVFKSLGTLREVSMPQNGITHVGIAALADALAFNPKLELINLNDNTFTEKGAKAFAQNMSRMSKLVHINFGDCLLKTEGALALAAALKEHVPDLMELNLGFNEIAIDGGLAIINAMDGKPVKKLELNGNMFGSEGCGEIQETLQTMGLARTLGSLSDDEEGGEEDSDNEKDEDEQEDEEGEKDDEYDDVIENRKEKLDEKSLTASTASCTVKEFLNEPSSQKFFQLGEDKPKLFLAEFGEKPTFDELLSVFTSVVCVAVDGDNKTKSAVCEVADALLERAIQIARESDAMMTFSNCMLVHLGLIKSEDKKFKPVSNLLGPFIILEHCVRQPYFVKDVREILQVFLSMPNKAINMNDKSIHLLKQALFQV